ncbi:YitT family protein [Alkalihalobacillus sp. LMS39]|uniref:YitT family protein n=1 Tax=Alkalihalobacillus sp. LMS39 TaxID=2924032 RepID=UPI001FB253E6|nr:YitT family protein [Alkalihalobacillus sp. LMS39]UOE94899.1 YitT family protein [Alkalihalobacillus sp. LMS39]
MKRILYILLGCMITSFGVIILSHSNIVTGGTAGLSLSLSYLLSIPFSITFFLINIPFYIFSVLRMGWNFTITTIISVTLLSVMTSVDQLLPAFALPSWFGAITGGLIIGFGLSLLFMNGSSLGGFNILSLFLQKKFSIDPGKTTFALDFLVVFSSIFIVGLLQGLYSIITIAVTAKVISFFKTRIASSQQPTVKKEVTRRHQNHVPVTES